MVHWSHSICAGQSLHNIRTLVVLMFIGCVVYIVSIVIPHMCLCVQFAHTIPRNVCCVVSCAGHVVAVVRCYGSLPLALPASHRCRDRYTMFVRYEINPITKSTAGDVWMKSIPMDCPTIIIAQNTTNIIIVNVNPYPVILIKFISVTPVYLCHTRTCFFRFSLPR